MNFVRKSVLSLLAVSVVASCGGSDESSDDSAANAPSDDAVAEVENSGVEPVDQSADQGADDLVLEDAATEEALDAYLDELGLNGPDPDSVFAGYRFWSDGVRFRETLPGGIDDLGDRSLENDTGVLAEQSASAGTGGDAYQRGVVSTDYDSAWLRNGTDELVRARFDSTELETFVINDLVPSGNLRSIGGDAGALYLLVNSNTGEQANFVIELDPATGEERRRIDLSIVGSNLSNMDVNATHIVVARALDEIVVVDRATLTEAFTLEIGDGEDLLTPLLTTDEIYVVRPGRGDVVDRMSRYSLSDGSELEAERDLPYAGRTRAFGDIVLHWHTALTDVPVYGLSPAGEQLVDALPDDIERIDDVEINDQFIVVGGTGAEDPDTRDRLGVFFIDRATNEVVWTLPIFLTAADLDVVSPSAG